MCVSQRSACLFGFGDGGERQKTTASAAVQASAVASEAGNGAQQVAENGFQQSPASGSPNLSLRGYWPLTGGGEALQRAGVLLNQPLEELGHPMPEQPKGLLRFFDPGEKLQHLGVLVS